MGSLRHDRRVFEPCSSTSRSPPPAFLPGWGRADPWPAPPAPQSFRPALSARRRSGSPSRRGGRRGASSISARPLGPGQPGRARSRPGRPMTEPVSPSVCRRGQAERGPECECECGQDRQGRTPPRPAPDRTPLGPLALGGLIGEPGRQAPLPAQAGAMRAPGHDLARLLGIAAAAVLVQLERQDGRPRSGQRGASYARPVLGASGRGRAAASPSDAVSTINGVCRPADAGIQAAWH